MKSRPLNVICLLCVVVTSLTACAGSDTEGEVKATIPPTSAATKTPVFTEQAPTPTISPTELSPRELGEKIGAVWVESLQSATALVQDKPPVTEVEAQVEHLKATTVQQLVELGQLREAMGRQDRAAVDNAINEIFIAAGKTDWYDTFFGAVQYYMEREKDEEFQQLLYSFNLIGQYANFDRLKQYEPNEALRLGIMDPP
jgi:hypothetical protein